VLKCKGAVFQLGVISLQQKGESIRGGRITLTSFSTVHPLRTRRVLVTVTYFSPGHGETEAKGKEEEAKKKDNPQKVSERFGAWKLLTSWRATGERSGRFAKKQYCLVEKSFSMKSVNEAISACPGGWRQKENSRLCGGNYRGRTVNEKGLTARGIEVPGRRGTTSRGSVASRFKDHREKLRKDWGKDSS